MREFVHYVVEGYIIFLFFDLLVLFSLVRQGHRSRKKARAIGIFTIASAIVWIDYYLIYTDVFPLHMALSVPVMLFVLAIAFHNHFLPYKTHCQKCNRRLSITEYLSSDENLCLSCYEEMHPEEKKLSREELVRIEREEKKKGWNGWAPGREFVIVFAFDEGENVLLLDNLKMERKAGRLSGAIGSVKSNEKKAFVAARTLKKETGLDCEEIDYMGRLSFEMPDMDIRFYVFVAREYSGSLKEDEEKKPSWHPLKKLNYDLMSMDYPLWLPRTLRGQNVDYYARVNEEGKIYDDLLELCVEL